MFKLHAPGLPTTYVTPTFNHDEAIAMARTQRLEYDPVIGVTYVLTEPPLSTPHTADKPDSLAKAEQAARPPPSKQPPSPSRRRWVTFSSPAATRRITWPRNFV